MDFDWHDEKSAECLRTRGFDFEFAARIFDDTTNEFTDERKDHGELRIVAIGQVEGSLYAVTYTQRDEIRWIISAFRCGPKELRRWLRHAAAGRSVQVKSTAPE